MKRVVLPSVSLQIIDESYDSILKQWDCNLKESHGGFAVFLEANLLSLCLKNSEVRLCIQTADWIFPDGVAVSRLAELQGGHPVERISGPTFFLKALDYGQERNWKHFLYGRTPESLCVLTEKLKQKFPRIQIVGSYAPPFRPLSPEEDADVKLQINASHADFLWVGLSGPKQELWIHAHQKELAVPFLLGVGAAFDFHSGRRSWAPSFIREIGMEWLWRACSGGRKTFIRNLRCVSTVAFHLAQEWIRLKIQTGKNSVSSLSQNK